MGELEARLYNDQSFDETSRRAIHILRHGRKELRNWYSYKGQLYCIVNGRLVDHKTAEQLQEEYRREGREKVAGRYVPSTRERT